MYSKNRQSMIATIEDFYAAKLNNYRNIYIYLPPGYDMEPDRRYPVLYLQDGQNIFYSSTSQTGISWELHKTADQLITEGKIQELIIVGIESRERGKEYSHTSWNKRRLEWNEYAHFEYSVEGRGELYEDFVIHELKPYIDENLRTLPEKENTALMGASAGGQVTFHMGIRHPEIFGMLGIISPSFFATDFDLVSRMDINTLKLWFDVGEKEPCLLEDTKRAVDLLLGKGYTEGKDLIYYQVPGGFHSNKDWGERASGPLIFFFGGMGKPVQAELTGRNIIGLKEEARINPVVYYDSGLIRSDLNASYQIENHEILRIKPDGTIIPGREGSTWVEYVQNDIRVSREYRLVEGLSKTVTIDFVIKVPDNTPEEAVIYADTYSPVNLPMERAAKGLYKGTFQLPRGLNVNYRLKMACENQFYIEKDMDLQEISLRHLYVPEDMKIHCLVYSWGTP